MGIRLINLHIVGELGYSGAMRSIAFFALLVLSAIAPAQSGSEIRRVDGSGISVGSGGAIAMCGDINFDGINDMLVGGDQYITWGTADAVVYSGLDGSIIWSWSGFTNAEAVAGAGDVNADGTPDLIVGAIWANSKAGQVKDFSGASGAQLFSIDGALADDYFGNAVAAAGDINNDGYDDFLVGAWGESAVLGFSGTTYIYSGLDGSLLRKYLGQIDHGYFGCALANVGDVDGDSVPDHLIGEVGNDTFGSNTGAAYLYSGATGTLINSWIGVAGNSRFGDSLASVGDIDGDSVPDFVIGAMFEDPAGHATVYSGATGLVLLDLHLFEPGEVFATSLSGGFDIDGDSIPDIVVGSDRYYNPNGYTGTAHVFSGATGNEIQRFHPSSPDGRLGLAVASLGDINGDGLGDYAAGAPAEGFSGHNSGSTYVISGQSQGVLLSVRELVAGGVANVQVSGATSNSLVIVGYSFSGSGPTNTSYGIAAMSMPISSFPPFAANALGFGEIFSNVPAGLSGLDVWCQAVDISAGVLSNSHPMRVY